MQLQRQRLAIRGDDLEHVRFLAHPDAPADAGDSPAVHERLDREEIIPQRRQPVPVVLLVLMVYELVFQQLPDQLIRPAVLESADGVDQLHRHQLVVFHAHFDRHQNPPRVFLDVAQDVHVELHLDVCLCLGFVGAAVSRGVCTVPYTPSRASPNQRRRREISAAAAACET